MRTFPAQSTPHKYAEFRCQSDEGLVSDLAVAQPVHARTRLRYGVSRPSRKSRICARRISQGGSVDAVIGDNVSPLTRARAGTMVFSPAWAATGSRMPRAPGSASEACPAHPRRHVKRDGACAVPLNSRPPCRAQPTWLPRRALALDQVVDGRGLRLAGVSP
jgi:hypothetical protein